MHSLVGWLAIVYAMRMRGPIGAVVEYTMTSMISLLVKFLSDFMPVPGINKRIHI